MQKLWCLVEFPVKKSTIFYYLNNSFFSRECRKNRKLFKIQLGVEII